jgi:SHOCT-like domain
MSDNRRRILEMVGAGKISVDDAERLLRALGDESETGSTSQSRADNLKARYLRVVVNHPQGRNSEGPEKVNIRVPVALIRAGMKFSSLIPEDASREVDRALSEKGIKLNLKNIKEEDLDELLNALSDLEVEIDNGGKVQIHPEF